MNKMLKIGFLMVLLVTAGYFFGRICHQVGQEYGLFLAPGGELLILLLRFFIAAVALAVTAGLVAGLFRPLSMAFLAFALSAVAILAGWEISWISGIMIVIYLLASCVYAASVAKDMRERIKVSETSSRVGQEMLLVALALVFCGSFYGGFSDQIKREGFTIPEQYIQTLEQQIEGPIGALIPEIMREQVLNNFRESFQNILGGFVDDMLEPYEPYIPVAFALAILLTLATLLRFLSWLPLFFLTAIYALLRALHFTKVEYQTVEVERLVLD
ncbi:MAG TPA: hypothetical protein G4O08_07800 [Anaerolineae bacterium]|nr:hypothetical protein [Anaerolineae bacterium]